MNVYFYFIFFQGFFVGLLFCFLNGEVRTLFFSFWQIHCSWQTYTHGILNKFTFKAFNIAKQNWPSYATETGIATKSRHRSKQNIQASPKHWQIHIDSWAFCPLHIILVMSNNTIICTVSCYFYFFFILIEIVVEVCCACNDLKFPVNVLNIVNCKSFENVI